MRNSQRSFIFALFLVISFVSKAGSDSLVTFWNIKENNKGKMYLYWGYNRAAYSNSDIKFKGRDYDFEIFDVRATDRQTKFDWNLYFHPAKITIPQTNLKFGYFFSDKYSFSIGVDHMKYVMDNTQSAKITGTVPDSVFSGTYTNDDIKLDESFLDYEHTDGLNYLNIEFNRFDGLIDFKNIISLQSIVGLGVAALMPKTNAILFGRGRYDEFHLAGFGMNVKTGLNLRIGKYFFIQTEGKAGYINMPDIRPTKFSDEKASQSFTFLEYTILFGINVKVK